MELLSDGTTPKPGAAAAPARRTEFDILPPDAGVPPQVRLMARHAPTLLAYDSCLRAQRNEGGYTYTLTDSADECAVVLEVAVGRFVDTAEVKVDVQPLFVRCIIRGRLLQVQTPEVRCLCWDIMMHVCFSQLLDCLCVAGSEAWRQLVPALQNNGGAACYDAQGGGSACCSTRRRVAKSGER